MQAMIHRENPEYAGFFTAKKLYQAPGKGKKPLLEKYSVKNLVIVKLLIHIKQPCLSVGNSGF